MGKESKTTPKRRFTKAELQALALQDAVNISDRFAREPVLGPTGKGYYKSAGIKGLKEDQAYLEALKKGEQSRCDPLHMACRVRLGRGHPNE